MAGHQLPAINDFDVAAQGEPQESCRKRIRQSRRKGASASEPEGDEPERGPSITLQICIHCLIGKGRPCKFTNPGDSHFDLINPNAGKVYEFHSALYADMVMLMKLCFKLAEHILKRKFLAEIIYYRFCGTLTLQFNGMLLLFCT